LINFAEKYPINNPTPLCKTTAINTINPPFAIASTFPETTADTIIIIAITEINGTTAILLSTVRGINVLTINQIKIGIIITLIIDIKNEIVTTGIHCVAKSKSSKGEKKAARREETDDIVREQC